MAVAGVVQREPFPQLVALQLGWVASMDPTFPLLAVAGVVQREPFPQLVALELGWVASMDPSFPLLER